MTRRPTPLACTENYPGADIPAAGDEWEFLKAMERYQRRSGRRYPTWREVLRVLRSLGYRKQQESGVRSEDRAKPPDPLPAS